MAIDFDILIYGKLSRLKVQQEAWDSMTEYITILIVIPINPMTLIKTDQSPQWVKINLEHLEVDCRGGPPTFESSGK